MHLFFQKFSLPSCSIVVLHHPPLHRLPPAQQTTKPTTRQQQQQHRVSPSRTTWCGRLVKRRCRVTLPASSSSCVTWCWDWGRPRGEMRGTLCAAGWSGRRPRGFARDRSGHPFWQGCGSGSAWIRINLSCWIRIRIQEGKNDPKNRKKYRIFMFWSAGCSLLRAKGFSCSLGVLYGCLGISKLQVLIKKIKIKISSCNFFPQY